MQKTNNIASILIVSAIVAMGCFLLGLEKWQRRLRRHTGSILRFCILGRFCCGIGVLLVVGDGCGKMSRLICGVIPYRNYRYVHQAVALFPYIHIYNYAGSVRKLVATTLEVEYTFKGRVECAVCCAPAYSHFTIN